ncbi:MAG: ATP-binding protein [Chloroflexi bacterium]|nr:ATP-binding protein [Chloroflexota bacterium]
MKLSQFIQGGEGQTVEFKTSLAERDDGTHTLVAFANSFGGKLLFGVGNDGTEKGVTVGENTIEELANYIKQHTYPTLPVSIDHFSSNEGDNKVIVVEVEEDTPPLTGVYLYSSEPIDNARRVDARRLQAYRRVGRVTQKENFMRMRPERPTDPLVVLGLEGRGVSRGKSFPTQFGGIIRLQEESRPIYDVAIALDPPIGKGGWRLEHIPHDIRREFDFTFECRDEAPNGPVWLVATYNDDAGLGWEARRQLEVFEEGGGEKRTSVLAGARFIRRIIQFPPKME